MKEKDDELINQCCTLSDVSNAINPEVIPYRGEPRQHACPTDYHSSTVPTTEKENFHHSKYIELKEQEQNTNKALKT